MEPVEHILMGAVLARAGFNRRAAYATVAMATAAEFPDIDTLWGLRGPLCGFEHHRGITHTFLGVPVEAALITGAFWLWHRWRHRTGSIARPVKAPVNWLLLYGGVLLALLSHLLLDWTNNYGIRPFFPFDGRWFAGSFVFIFEPVLFGVLLLALVLPALFGLINSEVGVRRPRFRGQASAWLAWAGVAVLYGVRAHEHSLALDAAQQNTPQASRVFASPHMGDIFLWSTVADMGPAYQLATVRTGPGAGSIDQPVPADTLDKPPASLAILAAKRTELGRIYLDWSMYPVVNETPDTTDPHHPLALVTFADARFMYNTTLMRGRDHPPIAGSVLLDMEAPEGDRVVETMFDGKVQK
jgi:inner membrane protein